MTTNNYFHPDSETIVKITISEDGENVDFVILGDDSQVSDEDLIQMVGGKIPAGWVDNSF